MERSACKGKESINGITMTDEARVKTKEELMQYAHDDPKYIIERGFWVVNKDKKPVPFIFNDSQNMFYEERTTRDDLVKAGQLGLSTEILAILTVKFLLVPNAWCVCISHEAEATQRLFEKVDYYLGHLPDWLKPFYVPGKTAEGDIVNKAMNSKFYIGTAGARAFGRGDTIHYAHLSESSRWKDKGRIMTGIIRAVPLNDPHTWIVKETTANGQGTPHQIEYKRAKEGRSQFKAHFLPFFSNPEYRIKGAKIPWEEQTQEERQLLARFPKEKAKQNKGYIDEEVLEWYRRMIGSLVIEDGRTPEEMMKQEFPVDDIEAFLFSGNPIFPPAKIELYKNKAPTAIFKGNIEGISPNVALDSNPKGALTIFKLPMRGSEYVIFADVSEGGDACSAHVVGKKSARIVATYHAHIDSHHFGSELNKLGHYYNKAEMAVEVNNMGISTINRLRDLEYPNMFMREKVNEKDKVVTKEYGFRTDLKTKPLIIGNMQHLLRTEQIPYIDMDTLGEMAVYVRHVDKTMGAAEGNNDDRVISLCGCYYVLKLHPFTEVQKKTQMVVEKGRKYKSFRAPKKRTPRRFR